MQNQLGFGGSCIYEFSHLIIKLVCLMNICLIFALLFDMHVIILYLS